ncbi:MAG: addiction module protein [Rhodopirellula sp.]|nr:addiction module protein [Rhodopirellula sp.]
MLLSHEQIQIEALSMPPRQRAELLERLINSLTSESNENVTQEWVALASERLDEIRSGSVTPIDGVDVLAKARKSLSK